MDIPVVSQTNVISLVKGGVVYTACDETVVPEVLQLYIRVMNVALSADDQSWEQSSISVCPLLILTDCILLVLVRITASYKVSSYEIAEFIIYMYGAYHSELHIVIIFP